MTIIAIASIFLGCACSFLLGYLAGWLDGTDRQRRLHDVPDWVRRPTTEADSERTSVGTEKLRKCLPGYEYAEDLSVNPFSVGGAKITVGGKVLVDTLGGDK